MCLPFPEMSLNAAVALFHVRSAGCQIENVGEWTDATSGQKYIMIQLCNDQCMR